MRNNMTHFFEVLSVEQIIENLQKLAQKRIQENTKEENIDLEEADNRVLAKDVYANEDLPLTNRSAMDGYAVIAQDSFGASDANPLFLKNIKNYAIDEIPEITLKEGECVGIVTGGIPPENADAVVMVEHTEQLNDNTIEIRKSVAPYTHMMLRGEDVKKDEIALQKHTFLNAQKIGMLAALGYRTVPVLPKVQVGILSTGDEVKAIDYPIQKGQVRDVNSYTLAALVKKIHAQAHLHGIVEDCFEDLQSKLLECLEKKHDLVLLSGGSSVGIRDYTLKVLESLPDCEIICHGIAMSPGKPVIFARHKDCLICGLPGQVTSAQIVMIRLVLPYIEMLNAKKNAYNLETWQKTEAILERNIASKHGREDYIRVQLERREGKSYARPILGHSGLLRTLVYSEGMMKIDAKLEGIEAGSVVEVYLF